MSRPEKKSKEGQPQQARNNSLRVSSSTETKPSGSQSRRKLSKEPSHSSQTTPAPQEPGVEILFESEVYKRAGRFKGTIISNYCPPSPNAPNTLEPESLLMLSW